MGTKKKAPILTRRAKRLAEYMEDELGWVVFNSYDSYLCPSGCSPVSGNYCRDCGVKLKSNNQYISETYAEIESALKYALEED